MPLIELQSVLESTEIQYTRNLQTQQASINVNSFMFNILAENLEGVSD